MKKRKKNNISTFILIILVIILILLSLYAFKDKFVKNYDDTNDSKKIETKSKKNDAEKENSDDKNTINTSKIDNSEPKKDEKAEIKQELNDNITINIELNGSENIELKKGDTYKELGARATDSNGNDVSQKIIIDGKVDTSKEGEYIVIYSIGKSMVMRNIIVK